MGHNKTKFIYRNLLVMVGADAFLVALSFFGAYLLRFEFIVSHRDWETITQALPFVLMVKLGTFAFFHLYQGM